LRTKNGDQEAGAAVAQKYRIRTQGLKPGWPREQVEPALLALFKRPLADIAPMLGGQTVTVKKGLGLAAATKYRQALEQRGCLCMIEADPIEADPIEADPIEADPIEADPIEADPFEAEPGTCAGDAADRGEQAAPSGAPALAAPAQADAQALVSSDQARPARAGQPAAVEVEGPLAAFDVPVDMQEMASSTDQHASLRPPFPSTLHQARPHLLPIVRESAERGQAMLMSDSEAPQLVYRSLCAGLDICVGYDGPDGLVLLTQSNLADWGVSEKEVFVIARKNVRALPDVPMTQFGQGVYEGAWDDQYRTSRLLTTDLMSRLTAPDVPVIMVPGKNTLLLTGENNEEGMALMVRRAEQVMGQPDAMAPLMLRLVDGKWRNVVPQVCALELNNMRKAWEAQLYDNQKPLLQKRLAAKGRDAFVATFMMGRGAEDQAMRSACTWSKGIDSLLPCTDMLCFVDPDGDTKDAVVVDWDDAFAVVGALMRKTKDHPARYYVSQFPDAQQLAHLRLVAARAKWQVDMAPGQMPSAAHAPGTGKQDAKLALRELAGMLVCLALAALLGSRVGAMVHDALFTISILGILAFSLAGLVLGGMVLRSIFPRKP
jgi:hypothetical protein